MTADTATERDDGLTAAGASPAAQLGMQAAAGDAMDGAHRDQPGRGGGRGRAGLWLLLSVLLVAGAGAFGLMALTGRPLALPAWAVARIETQINARLAGQGVARIGAVEVAVDADFVPRTRLRGVELYTATGVPIALLPEIRAQFSTAALLEGRIEPQTLRVSGAQVMLRRRADGALDLAFSQRSDGLGRSVHSLSELLDGVDAAFASPALAGIERIDVDSLGIMFDDQRAGQRWILSNGRLSFLQDAAQLSMSLAFELAGNGGAPASAQVSATSSKTTSEAGIGVTVAGVGARDLAAQVPALAWLGVLNAPISGAFRSGIDAEGRLGQLDGTLEIGRGALHPEEGVRPVPFDGAKVYFGFDPAEGRLSFRDISVESPALRARGSATAWLQGMETGFPTGLVAQVALSDLRADPLGLFENPVAFQSGTMDLKLALAPFRLTVGQFVLVDGAGHRLSAQGEAAVAPGGWRLSLDAALDAITHDRLIALWPVALVPRTRDWLAQNVTTGELFDVSTAIRLAPGAEPRMSLSYEFRGAEVRVLRTLPPVQDGSGYATIEDRTHTLVVDRGHVIAPNGERIDMAGSVMTVPDITMKPPRAQFRLRTESTISGALSLLDEPPFQLMQKAGRGIDLAEGRARADARLELLLGPKVMPGDLGYDVTAELTGLRSDKVVPGRELLADRLTLRADPSGLTIAGPGTISGVPFRMAWSQKFGPDQKGRSHLEGTVELSPRFVQAFRIGLPEGAVTGEGLAAVTIDTTAESPPAFRLTSDLNRVALSIPELGWAKPAAGTGTLEVAGHLGAPVAVDLLRLEAPGLLAEGSIAMKPDGTLEAVRLPRVRLGAWFEGSAELRGRGAGRPAALAVTGGWADLRKATFGKARGTGEAAPMTVALDRLAVSETISLNRLRGEFTTRGGFSGRFTGLVNGEAPVEGTVAPTLSGPGEGQTAVRLLAQDAGAVFRAAGIFSRARGGAMDLTLTPTGQKGTYDGALSVTQVRVSDAPVLAALLNAISVIGLLEQLNGEGILFSTVQGAFLLSPDRVEIRQGSAVGASLGVSMTGVYGLSSKRMELQGVFSPVYLVNALGQIVSRRGEGLFGFNYRISGTAAAPLVSVNPLSILTPGMFRELFRAAPPEVNK